MTRQAKPLTRWRGFWGWGYPGGPQIQKAAEQGNKYAISFPRVSMGKDGFDFSFSGVKTVGSELHSQCGAEEHGNKRK